MKGGVKLSTIFPFAIGLFFNEGNAQEAPALAIQKEVTIVVPKTIKLTGPIDIRDERGKSEVSLRMKNNEIKISSDEEQEVKLTLKTNKKDIVLSLVFKQGGIDKYTLSDGSCSWDPMLAFARLKANKLKRGKGIILTHLYACRGFCFVRFLSKKNNEKWELFARNSNSTKRKIENVSSIKRGNEYLFCFLIKNNTNFFFETEEGDFGGVPIISFSRADAQDIF